MSLELFSLFAKIGLDTSDFDKGIKDSKKSMADYKSDVMKLAQEYKKQGMSMSDAMKKAYAEIDKSQYDTAETSKQTAASFSANWGNAAESVKSSLSGAASALGSVLSAIGQAAAVGLGAASAAVVAFGTDAVNVGQSFDKSMSQVAATMGYSVEQLNTEGSEAANTFKQLRDFAQDMGAKTAFSASQAADALNYMALAGYTAQESMDMLPNVLNLAAAGGMELAAASDMITDSQSALGLSFEETTALVDKMAKASSKTNTSVSQLGSAILTVGGTAKAMKGGTTELAQVLGIIADNGVKGAEGGTALRNIILSLTAPTDKAAKTLKSLGVSALDSSGNMRSMKDIFADLNKSLGNMTEGQKTAVLSEIFNKVDLKSVNALISTNVERWDELSDAIGNASGAAEAMANTQLDNLAGDITIFQSALEGVKIAVSDEITPALREFVQLGTQGLSDLSAAIKEDGLGGAMKALAPFIDNAVGMLMDGIPKVVKFGGELLGAIATGIIDNLPKLAEGTLQVVTEFGGYLLDAAPAIMEKGAELLNFLADGILSNIDSMVDVALNLIDGFAGFLGDAIPAIASKATDIIIALAEALTDPATLSNLTQSAMAIVGGIATAIVENLPRLAETALAVIENFIAYLDESLPTVLDAGINFLDEFVQGFMAGLPEFIARVPEIIRSFMGTVTDNLPIVLSGGVTIIQSLTDGILSAIPSMMDALFEIITSFVDFMTDNFPIILDKAVELAGILVTAVIGALDEIGNKLAEKIPALSLLFENLETVVMAVVGAFVAYKAAMAITGLIDGVSKAISGAKAAFAALNAVIAANPFVLVATLIAGVVTALIVLWNTNEDFRNAVKEIWESITKFFTDAWETIKKIWAPVADYFGRIWEDIEKIFSAVEPVLEGFFSLAWEAVKRAWNVATGFFTALWHDIERVFSVVESVLGGFFSTAWAAIVLVWDAATGYFENIWHTIAGIFVGVKEFFGGNFSGAWEAVKEGFSGWGDYWGGLWNDLTNVFSHAFDWFFDVGANIVKGITEGISEKWNGLLSFLGLKTDEVKAEFTGPEGFDTHSPSKWSEKVFRNILEGGEIGLERGLPAMLDSAKDAVSGIQDALSADPFSVSGGYQLSGGYSYANAPQLAAAGAGYGAAQPIIINIQPSNITLNEQIVGKILWQQIRTQQRARGAVI